MKRGQNSHTPFDFLRSVSFSAIDDNNKALILNEVRIMNDI